jgi:hypothetical protein
MMNVFIFGMKPNLIFDAVAQFLFVVRKRIKLAQEQSLWIFVETMKNGKRLEVFPPAT